MAKDSSNGLSSALAGGAETIVARATPPGRGALAMIRMSGVDCEKIITRICGRSLNLKPWQSSLVMIKDHEGKDIDRGIVSCYRGPRSFTGEDMVELTIHASPYLVEQTLISCEMAGARRAEPGEFTRRAVANGKMDLIQAEGIRDLINAETSWQARLARMQVEGVLSERLMGLRNEMVSLLALLESSLDFSEHELAIDLNVVEDRRRNVVREIDDMLDRGRISRTITEGLRIVLAGPPNSGKSTLLNALSGEDRAIVSPHPGTTRDTVDVAREIAGIRVVLVDTAGIRDTVEPVEAEGVKRTESALQQADLVLLLWSCEELSDEPRVSGEFEILKLRSKSDLLRSGDETEDDWLRVSCETGEGLEALELAVVEFIGNLRQHFGDDMLIAERHRMKLQEASELLNRRTNEPELMAENVRQALSAVENLIGTTSTEDVFDEVFSGFCIGK